MTWVVDQSGTTAALTIGTETQLGSNSTSNATYVVKVNTVNMAAGDTLEIRLYAEDISTGSLYQCFKSTLANAQINPLVFSVPVPVDLAFKATLKQTTGTGRTFNWEILRI